MSIKLYTARVPKDRWDDFAAAVRATYLAEHPSVQDFIQRITDVDGNWSYRQLMGSISANDDLVELQLFDEGDTWLVRPLEQGWFFLNHIDAKAWPGFGAKTVFYDNRSDVPKKERRNKKVADWVDQQIESRRYLLYPILDRETYRDIYLNTPRGKSQ